MQVPNSWESFEELADSGHLTPEVFETFVKTHFSIGSSHDDSCAVCQEIDNEWYDWLFDEAEMQSLISVSLMNWLLSQMAFDFTPARIASEVPDAPLEWLEWMMPEFWSRYQDLMIDSDITVRSYMDVWSKNPNATSKFMREYVINVHETRLGHPSLFDDDHQEVAYDPAITCLQNEDVATCSSCQVLMAHYTER
jgi:hypothetical protein